MHMLQSLIYVPVLLFGSVCLVHTCWWCKEFLNLSDLPRPQVGLRRGTTTTAYKTSDGSQVRNVSAIDLTANLPWPALACASQNATPEIH